MALGDAFPGVSGGPDSVEARKALAGLMIRDTAGVARPGIFPRHANSLLAARADLKVDVLGFEGISVRGGGPNFMANDGVVQTPPLTVPVANSILHVIYFKQNESGAPFADANNLPIIDVLSSGAAPIPDKPDLSTIPGAVELGTVLMPTGKTATNQAGVVITGTHQFTTTTGGVLWFRTVGEMNAVTNLPVNSRAWVSADGLEYVWSGTSWLAAFPAHTDVRRRPVAAINVFNAATYADFPQAADKAALDMSFVKRASGTKMVVRVHVRAEFSSGTLGQFFTVGVNINGTDYEVTNWYPQATGIRVSFSGEVEIPGVGAGTLAIKPRVKYGPSAGVVTFHSAASDYLAYSVTETV